MSASTKPILAVTLGDAAGSGPELITKALVEPEVRAVCRPVVVGDASVVDAALAITRVPATVHAVEKVSALADDASVIAASDLKNVDLERLEGILQGVELADDGVRQLGVERPHLAVAGLNPHAGEGGLFGREEIDIIEPAIAEANRRGFHVSGPLAGDTVFFRTLQGEFD